MSFLFFFNDTATTEIYTLSLHDALPIYLHARARRHLVLRHDRPDGAPRDRPFDTERLQRLDQLVPHLFDLREPRVTVLGRGRVEEIDWGDQDAGGDVGGSRRLCPLRLALLREAGNRQRRAAGPASAGAAAQRASGRGRRARVPAPIAQASTRMRPARRGPARRAERGATGYRPASAEPIPSTGTSTEPSPNRRHKSEPTRSP